MRSPVPRLQFLLYKLISRFLLGGVRCACLRCHCYECDVCTLLLLSMGTGVTTAPCTQTAVCLPHFTSRWSQVWYCKKNPAEQAVPRGWSRGFRCGGCAEQILLARPPSLKKRSLVTPSGPRGARGIYMPASLVAR